MAGKSRGEIMNGNFEIGKSVKFNFIMNGILTMSSYIFPLITFPYITRVLLAEGYGKISFANSVISYFIMFTMLGIPTYGVREVAKVRDNKQKLEQTVKELLIINIIMAIISYTIFFVVLIRVPKIYKEKNLFIIASVSILLNAIGIEWLYKGLEQYSYITVRSIGFKVLSVLMLFIFVHKKEDYILYEGISVFASSASYLLNIIYSKKYVKLVPIKFARLNVKRHIKSVLIFFAMSCAASIYTHMDTVMLGFMTTDQEVGYYSAATKIKVLLTSTVTSLGTVLLPRVSYYIEHNMKSEFIRITRKAINFNFVIGLPLAVYFIIYAKEGILFLSGIQYENSINAMRIIIPTIVFIGLTNIMGIQILLPLGLERIVLYSEISGAVIDLILNLILIPVLKVSGAAIGTLVAEIIVFIIQYIYLRDIVYDAFSKIKYLHILVGILVAIIASIPLKLIWTLEMDVELSSFIILGGSFVLFFFIYAVILVAFKESIIIEIINFIFKKANVKKY